MVHLLASERPALAAASNNPFHALLNWAAAHRARRARRAAYVSLLDMDANRLADLGIRRDDLFEVLDYPSQRAGLKLSQRRAERARLWLDP